MNDILLQLMQGQEEDPFSAQGISQAVSKIPVSGVTIQQQKKSPISDDLFQALQARQLDSFKQQQEGLQQLEQELGAKKQGPNAALLAVQGLSDLLAGTEYIKGAQAQRQLQEQNQLKNKMLLQTMRKDLTKQEIDMLKSQFQHQQDAEKLQATMQLAREKMAVGGADATGNEFEKNYMRSLGKSLAEFTQNDRGTMISNLGKVDSAIGLLEGGDVMKSSKFVPDPILALTSPETLNARDSIRSAIVDTLRPTLGAAFTQKEGERIQSLAYDENLPPAENLKRARQLREIMAKKVQFQDDLLEYIRANNGSDRGFPYENYGMVKEGATAAAPSIVGGMESMDSKRRRLEELRKKAGK